MLQLRSGASLKGMLLWSLLERLALVTGEARDLRLLRLLLLLLEALRLPRKARELRLERNSPISRRLRAHGSLEAAGLLERLLLLAILGLPGAGTVPTP